MSPVTATSAGLARQTIDDPELVALLDRLSVFAPAISGSNAEGATSSHPVDVSGLVAELEKWPSWRFQEQADLYEWIKPLNAIDAALAHLLETYPSTLLIGRMRTRVGGKNSSKHSVPETEQAIEKTATLSVQAESVSDVASVPSNVVNATRTILRFLSNLLRNATNKSVFNSVDELADLLAASDDESASLSLEALSHLASPPMLHRQQAPEMQQHSTALHTAKPTPCGGVHSRLLALAKGWGSRSSGLGLSACVTNDDSISEKESLPRHAGEVTFDFFESSQRGIHFADDYGQNQSSGLVTIHISSTEMLAAEKRRRTNTETAGTSKTSTEVWSAKSTPELFFLCLDKAGGRTRIPRERIFPLLAELRLARAFHSRSDRIAAIERRLRALTCILHAHPSQDILGGYFHAQPEICSEIVDLVRPTVSPLSVTSTLTSSSEEQIAGISTLSGSTLGIPYSTRTLAVETLTALVARRDGSNGLTNVARQTNVLVELGVGKGQFLGFLPTLIRYALASLNVFLSNSKEPSNSNLRSNLKSADPGKSSRMDADDELGIGLGLAFVTAAKSPPIPKQEQEERALEFIDAVLTLTSAVVSVPSGTAALTDCGLIPALISSVALDSRVAQAEILDQKKSFSGQEDSYAQCLLKFISAQAVQILEGSIVTHNNALSAFHDLKGVDLLIARLHVEVQQVQHESNESTAATPAFASASPKSKGEMDIDYDLSETPICPKMPLRAARRVLLFSIVNCLTVVFHQQESPSTTVSPPSGGSQLRKPELTAALMDIMNNVKSYGGVLAALTATLLSDIMNSDPQVVHHVHNSGLARSFLRMLMGTVENGTQNGSPDDPAWAEASLPASSELIMAVPNVLSALSLTEDGKQKVREANPFPSLLSVFCSPKYAMPQSRCLLNEMTAIVGNGLDEIMRHVPSLRTLVMKSIVDAIRRIIFLGQKLIRDEEVMENGTQSHSASLGSLRATEIENNRTCLMQYAFNIGQLLEQILHNEEHAVLFFSMNGVDHLLDLYPLLLPTGTQFLSHVSCLSCPSVGTLTHWTTANGLFSAIKNVAAHTEPQKTIKLLTTALEKQLGKLNNSVAELRLSTNLEISSVGGIDSDVTNLLERIPSVALHAMDQTKENNAMAISLSSFLRNVVVTEWLTITLSALIRVACQRSHEMGSAWARSEREWKKELSSDLFRNIVQRLSALHSSAILEVCRIRTDPTFENCDMERRFAPGDPRGKSKAAVYRLRVVCAEGAVLRDGIEIDSCASVGSLEMGEIVEAFDRCVNSSGVLRYRTERGWLSEQTRGHDREPIAEVVALCPANERKKEAGGETDKRIDCGIPDLRSVSASIMARLQNSQSNMFSSLSRAVVLGIRSLPLRTLSLDQGTVGVYVGSVVKVMSRCIRKGFDTALSLPHVKDELGERKNAGNSSSPDKCIAAYLGNMLSLLHSCVYTEKRDRQLLNAPLLVSLLYADGLQDGIVIPNDKMDEEKKMSRTLPDRGFFGAIRYVLRVGLQDMLLHATKPEIPLSKDTPPFLELSMPMQRMSRGVASSFLPSVLLLRRLVSKTLFLESQSSITLNRMKSSELGKFLLDADEESSTDQTTKLSFNHGRFAQALHCTIAEVTFEFWEDSRITSAPANVINPIFGLISEVLGCLEDSSKTDTRNDASDTGVRSAGRPAGLAARNNAQGEISGLQQRLNALLGSATRVARNMSESNGDARNEMSRRLGPLQPSFEPSEETITRLEEMGFNRDHALEAIETTGSNRLEIAMEYALAHPPPSPGAAERRRQAIERRRAAWRQWNEAARGTQPSDSTPGDPASTASTGSEGDAEDSNTGEEGTQNSSAAEGQSMETTNTDVPSNQDNPEPSRNGDADGSNTLTEAELASQREALADQELSDRVQSNLQRLKNRVHDTALNIIEKSRAYRETKDSDEKEPNKDVSMVGSSEANAVTTVCVTFLLSFCERYPTKRFKVASELMARLDSYITINDKSSSCFTAEENEKKFSSLLHATVLFLRALPRGRPLAARKGLVSSVLQCVGNDVLPTKVQLERDEENSKNPQRWPIWLTSALLFLDVMAQPTAAKLDDDESVRQEDADDTSEEIQESTNGRREFSRLQAEHKRLAGTLSKTAKLIVSAVNKKPNSKKSKESEDTLPLETSEGERDQDKKPSESPSKEDSTFSSIPTYLPMMTSESAESCLVACLHILKLLDSPSETKNNGPILPSELVHAVLQLLARIVRSHKLASLCLRMGGAEIILSLPFHGRFAGHTSLATVIFRRILEDDAVLQTTMETEIRGLIVKQHKRQNRGGSRNTERLSMSSHSFVQAITPLICRDPLIFLKAAATTIKVEQSRSDISRSVVSLLSSDERAINLRLLSESFKTKESPGLASSVSPQQVTSPRSTEKQSGLNTAGINKRGRSSHRGKPSQQSKASKSKSPHRGSAHRRSLTPKKTGKKEKSLFYVFGRKSIVLNGTPANHIVHLLLNEIMASGKISKTDAVADHHPPSLGVSRGHSPTFDKFLSTADNLEIVTDLVLAFPSCAAAVHRFRPQCQKRDGVELMADHPVNRVQHAIAGSPKPPSNAVSFLIHELLPQARVAWSKTDELKEGSEVALLDEATLKQKKMNMYLKTKVSQSTARLLVALVARAGEGRRRVVADLACALGGRGDETAACTNPAQPEKSDKEIAMPGSGVMEERKMWALRTWGELCIGLAAPRSSSIGQDNNSNLSFEVVKLMMECRMGHSLMHGILKINLRHPLASVAAASLLRPLEVFTRGAVVDTIQEMAEKDEEQKDGKATDMNTLAKNSKAKKGADSFNQRGHHSSGTPHQNESAFADDAMLEDGFDAETAERNARRIARRRDLEGLVEGGTGAFDIEDENTEELDDEDFDDDVVEMEEETGSNEGGSITNAEEAVEQFEARIGDPDDGDGDGDDDEDDEEDDEDDDEDEDDDDDSNEMSDESSDDSDDEQSDDVLEVDEEHNVEEDVNMSDDDDDDDDDDVEEYEMGDEGGDDFFGGQDSEADGGRDDSGNSEGETDEGWTRVESSGLGGMFVGLRQGIGNPGEDQTSRQASRGGGMILQAAEAMLGNILRSGAGDLTLDSLAEIEDSLGIRIMHHQGDHRHLGSEFSSRNQGDNGTGITPESRAVSNLNRGNVDTMPLVHQNNLPDAGYSLGNSATRAAEYISAECLFAGPAIGRSGRFYDLSHQQQDDHSAQDEESFPLPSTFDTQLFPGGPAASTHSRTLPQAHPLLTGIEISPANAMVPQSRHRRPGPARERRPTGSSLLDLSLPFFSNQAGAASRSNRSNGGPLESQTRANIFPFVNFGGGWTEDGQPFDSTTQDFSTSFERALGDIITGTSGSPDDTSTEENLSVAARPVATRNTEDLSESQSATRTEPVDASQGSTQNMETDETSPPPPENVSQEDGAAAGSSSNINSAVSSRRSEETPNEGEMVASSLAAGLSISSRTDASIPQPNAPQPSTSASSVAVSVQRQENIIDNAENMEDVEPHGSTSSVVASEGATEENGNGASSAEPQSEEGAQNERENGGAESSPSDSALRCPEGMDLEVFNSLPVEMQREVVEQHQATENVFVQLDATSSLDPEALAALPEEMRREVIEQEQQERRSREETPADPSNAEEMDNASFLASLSPELREEILLTADETFLNSLPPNIVAEAHIFRERATTQHRRSHEDAASSSASLHGHARGRANALSDNSNSSARKRHRLGKIRVECDRLNILYVPRQLEKEVGGLITPEYMKAIFRLMYLLSPVRPQRLLQKFIQNLSANAGLRLAFQKIFISLLNDDPLGALLGVQLLERGDVAMDAKAESDFPPLSLIGAVPEVVEPGSSNSNFGFFRRKNPINAAAAVAANLPTSARGSSFDGILSPVVARRIVDTLSFLAKNSMRTCVNFLSKSDDLGPTDLKMSLEGQLTAVDKLLDLMAKPLYSKSATNLEHLLGLLECIVAPLSLIPKGGESDDVELGKKEIEIASAAGKEWVDVPRAAISRERLQYLCSILRSESCKDSSFVKVNMIVRRLSRIEHNRARILLELGAVAQALGADALRDLRALGMSLNNAAKAHEEKLFQANNDSTGLPHDKDSRLLIGTPSSSVTLSTSSSELKLLRVLQTIQGICGDSADDGGNAKAEGERLVNFELVGLLKGLDLEPLWDQLSACLKLVSVLEGVSFEDKLKEESGEEQSGNNHDDNPEGEKKLQNSVAGLLTRFLPTIEAFFAVNSSISEEVIFASGKKDEGNEGLDASGPDVSQSSEARQKNAISNSDDDQLLLGGARLTGFVAENRILLNALLRSNPVLLDKGLRAMVQVPRCRNFLDFDVKRQWFKTQVRRMRQNSNRRHGSLRLSIRRMHVFEDAYHQLRLRNADEMRGRLHITFRNEEGVDAGGLSREFFAILAKEMFNPNYALFTSTEDGCTFQPNPNSSINPDHLTYFRFVGRIVGKAVVDGFLLDAHFTRSLYKHMLGVEPTHHDMQAIDPDYYKNLKTILEYNLDDIGLDLTFSTEEHSFGRSHIIDLIQNGRNIRVTEETKSKYVSLVCQHRMTTAIKKQIDAYLSGFYELVKPEHISIFTAKELELLISGMPEIDILDLKQNTEYNNYKVSDKEIMWFWNIMFSLTSSEKAAFLQFVTGSSKVPLAGFAELQGMRGVQKFSIHKAGGSSGALISAHTCFNALDLPVYKSEEEMRGKLLYAINEGGGGFLFA